MSVWRFQASGLPRSQPLSLGSGRPLRSSGGTGGYTSKRLPISRCGRGRRGRDGSKRLPNGSGISREGAIPLTSNTRAGRSGSFRSVLPWPYNTSHDSGNGNDSKQHDDDDDPNLGGIKWYFFLGKKNFIVLWPLSLNRSWIALSGFRVNSWGCRRRWSFFNEDIRVIAILYEPIL